MIYKLLNVHIKDYQITLFVEFTPLISITTKISKFMGGKYEAILSSRTRKSGHHRYLNITGNNRGN